MTDELSIRRAARRREATLRLTSIRARLRWSPHWEAELHATGRWWYVAPWLVLLPLIVADALRTVVAWARTGDVRMLSLCGAITAVATWQAVALARRQGERRGDLPWDDDTRARTVDEPLPVKETARRREITLGLASIRTRLRWHPHWEAELRATGCWWCVVAWLVLVLSLGSIAADVLRALVAWAWPRDARMLALCGAIAAAATWRATTLARHHEPDSVS